MLLLTAMMLQAAPPAEPRAGAAVAELEKCRAIGSDRERLACYDKAAGRLTELASSGKIAVIDEESVRETERSAFGYGGLKMPFFGAKANERSSIDEITTKVRSVSPAGYMMGLSLEDGSRWVTTENVKSFHPKAGQELTIKRGLAGGYLAFHKGSGHTRVRRVD